nr:hypothetical protein [Tanacetum cinerariifolium]
MSTPTFAETHNLVAFLENPAESVGFEQIIDFLKSKPIHYALTVNPTIYVSCVKQFWATTELHAPKRDLRLIDEHFESVFVDVISNIAPSDVKTVKTIDVDYDVEMAYDLLRLIEKQLMEVIKNGNKVLTRIVRICEETYEPTSVEEKLDKMNEMKARGTLLMALPNKDQLKFHSYQDAKLLMEAIEKSTSSTNEADTTASGVSTAYTQEDLEKIDPDDLEEMDLHWEMTMLTIRARRFMKRTGRNLDMNGQRIGFDKSNVECFNCHKNGHFARECRAPKNQDNRGRAYERNIVLVESLIENALIAQDGIGGYDWSYQAKKETPTNYTLMALNFSGSSSNSESE